MRRVLAAAGIALWCASVGLSAAASLQAIIADTHQSGAASFTGIGDTLSGAKGHWGVIAYSAASRGSNMLNLCNVGDVACADVATDATTGIVSSTQVVGSITCGTGANLCTVKKLYDDSGANLCTGSVACTLDNVSGGSRPTFVPNCIGTVPCIQLVSGSHLQNLNNFVGTLSQPISRLGSISIPSAPGAFSTFMAVGLTDQTGVDSSPAAFNYDGNVLSGAATLTANTFYSILGTQDGSGNGTVVLNGATTTGSVGTATASTTFVVGATTTGGNPFVGNVLETAVYNVTFTGTNITNLTSTQRTNGGF